MVQKEQLTTHLFIVSHGKKKSSRVVPFGFFKVTRFACKSFKSLFWGFEGLTVVPCGCLKCWQLTLLQLTCSCVISHRHHEFINWLLYQETEGVVVVLQVRRLPSQWPQWKTVFQHLYVWHHWMCLRRARDNLWFVMFVVIKNDILGGISQNMVFSLIPTKYNVITTAT